MFKTGKFDYHQNCSIVHTIPQGEQHDGRPVIIFPRKDSDVIAGRTYEYAMVMTREATYTIDHITYRVAHAIIFREVDGASGDIVDTILHNGNRHSRTTLGDAIGGDTAAKLKALKQHLAAK